MLTAVAYFATAALCLWIVHRAVIRIRGAIALAIVLMPLAFTGKALLTGRIYAPVDIAFAAEPLNWYRQAYDVDRIHNALLSDVYSLNIPWKYAVRRAYSRGELALWNPSLYCGDILAAAAQPTPYEPLFLISLLLPMANSLTYLAAITLFLGVLLMYVFLRELEVEEWPSLIGAATWAFSMFFVFWLEWVITPTFYWMPLVLTGVRRIIRTSSARALDRSPAPVLHRLGGFWILTAAFGMMMLSGHPESALHIVTIGLAWAAAELWAARGRGISMAAIQGVGAGALSLLIVAIYLLPMVEVLPNTFEHSMRKGFFAKITRSETLPRATARLEAQVIPFIHGQPQSEWPEKMPFVPQTTSAYCGSAAIALAIYGAWRSRARVKWLALALVAAGLLLGVSMPPFQDLLATLPLFDIAINERLVAAAILGIAILAALGAQALERYPLAFTSILAAAILAGLTIHAWPRMTAMSLSSGFLVKQSLLLIGAPLIMGLIALSVRSRRFTWALFLFVILAARTIESGDFYPTLRAELFYPRVDFFRRFPKSAEPYRITGYSMAFVPNLATMYDLEDVRGYQAMTLSRVKETIPLWSSPQGIWWNRVDDLTSPFLSAMNVRFAIASPRAHPPPGWRKVPGPGAPELFENTHVLGRAYVPRRVRLGDTGPVLKEMKHAVDFSEVSWIQRTTLPDEVPTESENGPGSATTRVLHSGELVIHASMKRSGWVVISETAWNGWTATVDGTRTRLRYANHSLLGIYVPQGNHTIRLRYMPRGFVIGAWVSGITIGTLLLAYLARFILAHRARLTATAAS